MLRFPTILRIVFIAIAGWLGFLTYRENTLRREFQAKLDKQEQGLQALKPSVEEGIVAQIIRPQPDFCSWMVTCPANRSCRIVCRLKTKKQTDSDQELLCIERQPKITHSVLQVQITRNKNDLKSIKQMDIWAFNEIAIPLPIPEGGKVLNHRFVLEQTKKTATSRNQVSPPAKSKATATKPHPLNQRFFVPINSETTMFRYSTMHVEKSVVIESDYEIILIPDKL